MSEEKSEHCAERVWNHEDVASGHIVDVETIENEVIQILVYAERHLIGKGGPDDDPEQPWQLQ